ncbi:MAG: hypothetical protein RLZZ397_477 [Pseudomonadota bacterium]|jgi:iron(III) transport system permease protein
MRSILVPVAIGFLLLMIFPLLSLFSNSFLNEHGQLSIVHWQQLTESPGLFQAAWNTLWVALTVTLITVPLAFAYAYAIQRTCIPLKGLWRVLGLSALLGPSLVGAISFVQWFGNQGVLKSWLGETSIYGPLGIVLATVYSSFPHAFMILLVALATTDGRLYEAADAMKAHPIRKFMTVTLPGVRFGLISSAWVVFAYSISEFGIPKVLGGNFKVLAVEIYTQVVGLQNFNQGAVVSIVLLIPVMVGFALTWRSQQKQQALLTSRATLYKPPTSLLRDSVFLLFCIVLAAAMLAVIAMAIYSSLVKFWPYNLSLTLNHYTVGLVNAGVWDAYFNSIQLSLLTAAIGTPVIFFVAYLLEKTQASERTLKPMIRLAAALPMGIPGMVLGIGYILFFNHPNNPLQDLYHTLLIMVLANVIHYYTPCHLTATTALKNIDKEFEAVSASLKVSAFTTLWRVTLPICTPAVLDIGRYLFVNSMTTVSALVFLYSTETIPASVSILHLDEAGDMGAAAAMATLIILTSLFITTLYTLLTSLVFKRQMNWLRRS